METIDCVVAGAGVVGLATARALAQTGRQVLVLDGGPGIGHGISSRNSEVIHAGIYYPTGSLKARLCVEGKHRLYQYCAERGIPHRPLGKLIVAANGAECETLSGIQAKAASNGVTDLRPLSPAEIAATEPALGVAGALLSPSTGIIDSHAYMLSLQADLEEAGGAVVLHAPINAATVEDAGTIHLQVGGPEPMDLRCALLVNAAGLHAPHLARRIEGLNPTTVPHPFLCKGSYYQLAGRAPFSHLVYPVPEKAGLGVHLTLDLGNQARFGPDTEWIETENYDVDPSRAAGFYAAIRRYWPGLPDGALSPAYAGIRPKISGPDQPNADFLFSGPAEHGIPALLNLYGIESPGLTASLALADHALTLLH